MVNGSGSVAPEGASGRGPADEGATDRGEGVEPAAEPAVTAWRVVETFAPALVVLVLFAHLLPGYWPTADDAMQTAVYATRLEEGGSTGRALVGMVFEAWGGGHFKPVQDVVGLVAFRLFGESGWSRAVMSLYLLMHASSAVLLAAILRRLRVGRPGALLAALLFAAHPVVDESLTCVLFGPNLPGVFFTLLGVWLWSPPGRRLGPGRILGGASCAFLAMGCNLVFALSAPAILGGSLLARGPAKALWRRVRVPWAALLVAGLAMAGLRLFAQGTVLTTMESYRNREAPREILDLGDGLLRQFVLLEPSATHDHLRRVLDGSAHPPLARAAELGTTLEGLLGVVAWGLAAVALFGLAGRRRAGGGRVGWGPGLWFGALFFVAGIAPYFAFLHRIDLNRYLYAALPGFATLAAVAVSACAALCFRSVRGRAGVCAVAGCLLLVPLVYEAAFAARCLGLAHATAARLVRGLERELSERPAVRTWSVLDLPRQIGGRVGITYAYAGHPRVLLREIMGREFFVGDESLLTGKASGWLGMSGRASWAVFRSDAEGEVRCLEGFRVDPGGPWGRALIEEHRASRRGAPGWADDLLRDGRVEVVRRTLEVLERDHDAGASALRGALNELAEDRPLAEFLAEARRAGLALLLDEAVARSGIGAEHAFALGPGLSGSAMASLASEGSGRSLWSAYLAASIAAGRPLPLEVLAGTVAPARAVETSELRALLERETDLRGRIRGEELTGAAEIEDLRRLAEAFRGRGVPRPDLALAAHRAAWSARTGRDFGATPSWIGSWLPEEADREAAAAVARAAPGARVWSPDLRVVAARSGTEGTVILLGLGNAGGLHLPGGLAPHAPVLEIQRQGEETATGRRRRALPPGGVRPGRARWLPLLLEEDLDGAALVFRLVFRGEVLVAAPWSGPGG